MQTAIKSVIAAIVLFAAGALALPSEPGSPESRAAHADRREDEGATLAVAVPRPAAPVVAREVLDPWIEPGTPHEFLRPYLSDHRLVAIHCDGRQVYEGVPMLVRNPDGSTRSVPTRIELEPAAVAPLHPSEASVVAR